MIELGLGLGAAALAAGAYWVSRAPVLRTSGDLRLHRLRDGVFMYRGFFSNSAVLRAEDGALVVDTQVAPRAALRLRDAIAAGVGAPVTHVVNTHYHGDHSGGNATFAGAEIVASEETARYIVERDAERLAYARTFGLEFNHVHETALPTRTFTAAVDLLLRGARFEVRQLGGGETTDASVVHWPERGVVACGDAVTTWDYPFLGVPFLDEGLRDDGQWLGVLRRLRALEPEILIPGHGPALVGKARIAARLRLLESLYGDLLAAVKEELAAGRTAPEIVERVGKRLAHYPARRELYEHTVSQRFAIYRCINSLSPERVGKGWWQDLRPSAVRRASPERVADVLAALGPTPTSEAVRARASLAAASKERDLAVALLETWLRTHADDGAAGLLCDVLFDGARETKPAVDGMEFIATSSALAKEILARAPGEPLALLCLGCAEILGAMVLAQDTAPGIAKLTAALESRRLSAAQRQKAHFFLGKAHQVELRDADSDRHLRAALPPFARFAFPLLRERLRALP